MTTNHGNGPKSGDGRQGSGGAESAELLEKRARLKEPGEAGELAEELGRLPLAPDLAAGRRSSVSADLPTEPEEPGPGRESKGAGTDYEYDVFVSYSHADDEWVTEVLLPRVEATGLKVCIDYRDFVAGRPAIVNMQEAGKNSRHTVVVLSPNWAQSEWTLFETLLTRTADPAGLRRRTVPVMIEPCRLPELLSTLTWVDFTRPDREETAWERLLVDVGSPRGIVSRPKESGYRAMDIARARDFLSALAQLKRDLEPERVAEYERKALDQLWAATVKKGEAV